MTCCTNATEARPFGYRVRLARNVAVFVVIGAAAVGCTSTSSNGVSQGTATTAASSLDPASSVLAATKPKQGPTNMGAPQIGSVNVYRNTTGALDPRVATITPRVYVPNSDEGTVSVIDPATYSVISTFKVGNNPQHIGPSWDLKALYVSNDLGNSLTPIDPSTGAPSAPIPISDPYNLYYTTDGKSAIVVAERMHRIDFRDPTTWKLQYSVPIPHKGANHLDFSADGKSFLISCEFSGWVVKVDLASRKITGELNLGGQPIDVKLSPDGTVFYVANMARGGVSIVDPTSMTELSFLKTGLGAHGLYPSRDATKLYVSNRHANSVSVIDFWTRKVIATWRFRGSPDMGGVSANGRELWLSGRYNAEVYVLDTSTGLVTHRIPVGRGPHGLTVFPQPGKYSLGHTGNYR